MLDVTRLIKEEHQKLMERNDTVLEAQLRQAVQTEVRSMLSEVRQRASSIDEKLEVVRKELWDAGKIRDIVYTGVGRHPRAQARLPIAVVSQLIDETVGDLTLHFLNGTKLQHEPAPIDYALGHVRFHGY